jgi:hypothetical protein
VGGGSRMGKIGLFTAGRNAGCARGRFDAGIIGCAGVPNAGDDEKTFPSFCFRIESIVLCFVVSRIFIVSSCYPCERVATRSVEDARRVKCRWSERERIQR